MKYDIGLVGLNGQNYGTQSVVYAHYKTLSDMGFLTKTISYGLEDRCLHLLNADEYVFFSSISPELLNKQCNMFMLCSDQQMNPDLFYKGNRVASLDWTSSDKYKSAFGMSFSNKKIIDIQSSDKIADMRNAVSNFDVIYTRGEHEAEILKEKFGRVADGSIIDPVFLLSKQEWCSICDKQKKIQEKYIFAYILDMTETKQRIIDEYAQKLGLKIILFSDMWRNVQDGVSNDYSLQNFYQHFRDANIVLTDSFHGTCFSVIFNKPFLTIGQIFRGKLRFAIFDKLGLKNFRKETFEEALSAIDDIFKINWTIVNKNIEKEKRKMKVALKHCARQLNFYTVFLINIRRFVRIVCHFSRKYFYKTLKCIIKFVSNFIPFKEPRRKFRKFLNDFFQ